MSGQQLDLFDPPVIQLPPCGRGLGPCNAIVEPNQIRCIRCGCIAPRGRNTAPSIDRNTSADGDALRAVLNGFMESQLNFFEFLRQQELPPDDSGKSGDQGAPTS
jgi:hypothetical protein